MRTRIVALIAGFILLTLFGGNIELLPAQTSSLQSWNLPQGTTVKDSGPRTYRFTVDYNTVSSKGDILRRQRLTAEYTRGLAGNDVVWKNVAQADADGPTAPFGAAQKRDFMEGFRYHNNLESTLKPDFFKGFPPTAVLQSLVENAVKHGITSQSGGGECRVGASSENGSLRIEVRDTGPGARACSAY